MITLEYSFYKLLSKVKHDKHKETLTRWFKRKGVNVIGDGPVYINSNVAKQEPHLITIGENTTIAGGVELVTHDNSISKVIPNTTDLFGKITIGKNCFIGARSIILYGVTIPDNVIVAAGSVVTKTITKQYVIVAGNPARVISTWAEFGEKSKPFAWDLDSVTIDEMRRRTLKGEKIVIR